jgi:hypothetical protein
MSGNVNLYQVCYGLHGIVYLGYYSSSINSLTTRVPRATRFADIMSVFRAHLTATPHALLRQVTGLLICHETTRTTSQELAAIWIALETTTFL